MSKEKFTFFWRTASPFSQWHPTRFTVNGTNYSSAEQYMMHQKALLFGDQAIADKIMKANSPSVQKKLGRQVAGFDQAVWEDLPAHRLRRKLRQIHAGRTAAEGLAGYEGNHACGSKPG